MPSALTVTGLTGLLTRSPRLGDLVDAAPSARLGRGSRVESATGLVIGDRVTIGRGCQIEADGAIGDGSVLSNGVRVQGPGRVELEGENWVGAGATLVAPVTLERGAVVAPGSVVTGHVPAMTIASGDPARVIGARFSDDVLRGEEDERLATTM